MVSGKILRKIKLMFRNIAFSLNSGHAKIQLGRRDNKANALNSEMIKELYRASQLCQNKEVRVVSLSSNGKMFCGGGDLNEFNTTQDKVHLAKSNTYVLHRALINFSRMNAPMVAVLNGTVAGGGMSLALCCDYIISTPNTKMVAAYTASGLSPDASSTYFLAKHVGLLRAKELFLTNRVLDAVEAHQWGLINQIVSAEKLFDELEKIIDKFSNGPTLAFGVVKRLLETTFCDDIEAQLNREAENFMTVVQSADACEGLKAFVEKQNAKFQGK